MIRLEQQQAWIRQQLNQVPDQLLQTELEWLGGIRAEARDLLPRLPLLDRRQEAWRYTSVEGLMTTPYRPAAAETELPAALVDLLPQRQDGGIRVLLLDGRWLQGPDAAELPDGVRLASLRETLACDPAALAIWFNRTVQHAENVFTALNTALATEGVFLHLAEGVELERPIEVIHLSSARQEPVITHPRSLIVLEQGATAEVIEHFLGAPRHSGFNNHLNEILLQEGAGLSHCRIQNEAASGSHLSTLFLTQAADSHYRGQTLSFGGAWARTDYRVWFTGPGADCDLSGLYTVAEGQLNDIHLDIRHSVPGCSSRERFKGVLHGKGRAVFDGRVVVERDAQGSDARLSNDNLMLCRDAEIDTKPQLEIYADDVKCSHGTTVGQIEPEQLFYLRSRGIGEPEARRMLSLGFAGEIIEGLARESLRELAGRLLAQAMQAAEQRLE